MKKFFYILFLMVIFIGCEEICPMDTENSNFSVLPTEVTKNGIAVENPFGDALEIKKVFDDQTVEVVNCLKEKFGSPLKLPNQTRVSAFCYEGCGTGLDYQGEISVKIIKNFSFSDDGTQELLPLEAPKESCQLKGLEPQGSSLCQWRVAVQNCTEIILPPSGYLFKEGLVKVLTGCTNPWVDALLAECMKPTVAPLSGLNPG